MKNIRYLLLLFLICNGGSFYAAQQKPVQAGASSSTSASSSAAAATVESAVAKVAAAQGVPAAKKRQIWCVDAGFPQQKRHEFAFLIAPSLVQLKGLIRLQDVRMCGIEFKLYGVGKRYVVRNSYAKDENLRVTDKVIWDPNPLTEATMQAFKDGNVQVAALSDLEAIASKHAHDAWEKEFVGTGAPFVALSWSASNSAASAVSSLPQAPSGSASAAAALSASAAVDAAADRLLDEERSRAYYAAIRSSNT